MSTKLEKARRDAGPYEMPPACGGRLRLFKGDVRHWLPKFDRLFFDAAITDPPYELGFMGHSWDKAGIAFDPAVWRAVLLTVKPGAHLLMFAGKFAHRMMVAAEDGGFEVVDKLLWMHGQGFPKGMDVGLGIDARSGVPRPEAELVSGNRAMSGGNYKRHKRTAVTEPAKRWHGYKTALKPAYEECPLFRRPLAGTYAENVLLYDTGGLNVAGTRIGTEAVTVRGGGANHYAGVKSFLPYQAVNGERTGRYPANVVLSHHPLCRKAGAKVVKGRADAGPGAGKRPGGFAGVGAAKGSSKPNGQTYGDQVVEGWHCVNGCPVRMLDRQSGVTKSATRVGRRSGKGAGVLGAFHGQDQVVQGHAGTGTAVRFFYVAKVSRSERDAGCRGSPRDCDNYGDDEWGRENRKVAQARNDHPCVKPIDLCRYFATLILPPPRPTPRRIIVPFAGSGSEAIGAMLAGWDEVWMVESDAHHLRNAAHRAEHWSKTCERSGI